MKTFLRLAILIFIVTVAIACERTDSQRATNVMCAPGQTEWWSVASDGTYYGYCLPDGVKPPEEEDNGAAASCLAGAELWVAPSGSTSLCVPTDSDAKLVDATEGSTGEELCGAGKMPLLNKGGNKYLCLPESWIVDEGEKAATQPVATAVASDSCVIKSSDDLKLFYTMSPNANGEVRCLVVESFDIDIASWSALKPVAGDNAFRMLASSSSDVAINLVSSSDEFVISENFGIFDTIASNVAVAHLSINVDSSINKIVVNDKNKVRFGFLAAINDGFIAMISIDGNNIPVVSKDQLGLSASYDKLALGLCDAEDKQVIMGGVVGVNNSDDSEHHGALIDRIAKGTNFDLVLEGDLCEYKVNSLVGEVR